MKKTIICDTRQKLKHHVEKEAYFERHGATILRSKLPVGDYAKLGDWSVIVDTKKDIQEAIGNICGREHSRFRRECELARDSGISLVILIADENVRCIDDLYSWDNPRLNIMQWVTLPNGKKAKVPKYPKATSGTTLARAMTTMEMKYEVKFMFCKVRDQGKVVLDLLGMR